MARLPLIVLFAGLVASPALAQTTTVPRSTEPTPASDTVRLSDEERSAILDRNTVESAAAARGEMTGSDRAKLEVHGEVSAFVGSNGSRGIAGVAAVPLGSNAGAVVSFESSRYAYHR